MSDLKIILLKNPFNPADVEIFNVNHIPNKTAYQYVQHLMLGQESFVVSVNGYRADEYFIPKIGDNIAVCATVGKGGGGKNILRTIAMIALSVYAGNIAGSTNLWKLSPFMRAVAGAAVMAVGGMLINAVFPIAQDTSNSSKTRYGWQDSSVYAQGNPLNVTFGTYRTKGMLISQHISYNNEKQYLHLIYTGGQGEIDSISDITINGNPAEYYDDVTIETRLGINDQPALSDYFSNNYSDKSLSYKLELGEGGVEGNWYTELTEGNAGEELQVVINFPAGLYQTTDSGGTKRTWVKVQIQHKEETAIDWIDDGTKEIWATDDPDIYKSAFTRVYSISDLTPSKRYNVRVRLVDNAGSSIKYINTVYWSQLTQVIKTNFCRPNKVIVALRILATDQLSGSMPEIAWNQTRNNVNVWNPNTSAYEQKPANNPAWACYDIIHDCRKLQNVHTGKYEYIVFGKPISRLTRFYDSFVAWADYCTEKNLMFNYIFMSTTDLWGAMSYPESIGRGKVILRGTSFACTCDAPSTPKQLFSVGNIGQSEFKESYLELSGRANAVEVTFYNIEKDYEQDIITIYGENYDSSEGEQNPSQITLDGCVSYEQAVLAGKYFLRLNKYLTRTVSFLADIDAITCQAGDVIICGHDVLNMDGSNEDTGGGRIVSAIYDASGDYVVLDRKVLMDATKNYAIIVQDSNDNIMQKTVQYVAGETDTIQIVGNFSSLPEQYAVYTFGQLDSVKDLYRIVSITRSGEMQRQISALEYIEEVYDDDGIIPDRYINFSKTSVPEISGATPSQVYYRQGDGTVISNVDFVLTYPLSGGIKEVFVYYMIDGDTTWRTGGLTEGNTFNFRNALVGRTYQFKFVAGNGAGLKSPNGFVVENIYITGKDDPPNPVTSFTYVEVTGGFMLSWLPNTEPDISGYNIWQGKGNVGIDLCTQIADNLKASSLYVPITSSGEYTFYISSMDNSKNNSITVPLLASFSAPPDVTNFEVVRNGDNLKFSWDAVNIVGASYELRRGSTFAISDKLGIVQGTSTTIFFPVSGSHIFWIKAIDQLGNYSDNAVFTTCDNAEINSRNVVLVVDQKNSQEPWKGVKFNCSELSEGLAMDSGVIYGEHIVEVNLPDTFYARNWVLYNVEGISGNVITWGSANFTWDSEEAKTPWLAEGDLTSVKVTHKIALKSSLNTNIVESFPLNESLSGERGTSATESVSATDFRDGRFRQGLYISDATSVAWDVNIPSVFATYFYARKLTDFDTTNKTVFATFTGSGIYLQIGYNPLTNKFYMYDGTNINECAIDFRTQDIIQFGIVQKDTERKFMVKSLSLQVSSLSTESFTPLGAFTNLALYPK